VNVAHHHSEEVNKSLSTSQNVYVNVTTQHSEEVDESLSSCSQNVYVNVTHSILKKLMSHYQVVLKMFM
jgi:hypothetical protein